MLILLRVIPKYFTLSDVPVNEMIFLISFSRLFIAAAKLLSHFSRVRLWCDPRDGSPPGSPVPGILQARTLEWVVYALD